MLKGLPLYLEFFCGFSYIAAGIQQSVSYYLGLYLIHISVKGDISLIFDLHRPDLSYGAGHSQVLFGQHMLVFTHRYGLFYDILQFSDVSRVIIVLFITPSESIHISFPNLSLNFSRNLSASLGISSLLSLRAGICIFTTLSL